MKTLLDINDLNIDINGSKILNLRNKTITIQRGDIVGIIGENGAGKTSFINCIINKLRYSGEIRRNYSSEEIGIQFQTNHYNKLMKVFELIQIVSGKNKFDLSLKEEIKKFEIEQLLNKKIGKLSIGEQQRLTLFLVLYLKPQVLIFDELTTGLDYRKRTQMLEIVKDYCEGKTVLSVTHYYEELINWANKILILHKGNLVFWGTYQELSNNFQHYSIVKISIGAYQTLQLALKDIKTIELDDQQYGLITKDVHQQEEVLKIITKHNIQFQINPNSIYNLYSLALKNFLKERGGKYDEDIFVC